MTCSAWTSLLVSDEQLTEVYLRIPLNINLGKSSIHEAIPPPPPPSASIRTVTAVTTMMTTTTTTTTTIGVNTLELFQLEMNSIERLGEVYFYPELFQETRTEHLKFHS